MYSTRSNMGKYKQWFAFDMNWSHSGETQTGPNIAQSAITV